MPVIDHRAIGQDDPDQLRIEAMPFLFCHPVKGLHSGRTVDHDLCGIAAEAFDRSIPSALKAAKVNADRQSLRQILHMKTKGHLIADHPKTQLNPGAQPWRMVSGMILQTGQKLLGQPA